MSRRGFGGAVGGLPATAALVAALFVAACGSDDGAAPQGVGPGGSGAGGGDVAAAPAGVDLLLVVDNSRLMADKQRLLAEAVPRLLDGLTSPPCLDGAGEPVATQPGPEEPCPSSSARAFEPVTDIHLAVISTSLGGHGADACDANDIEMENDRARLLDRTGPGSYLATYADRGYLAWDPRQQLQPTGEQDREQLSASLAALVLGAGQVGCGYEATHESWYRFLVDPDPHADIVVEDLKAERVGTDEVVLWQRAAFLRPDSAVAILVLSDENDCSLREGGQMFLAAQLLKPGSDEPYHLPRARAACATNPADPCCRSCGQPPGEGCDASADLCDQGPLPSLDDNVNLRCYEQKRRFGIDFLYPIGRYVDALQRAEVTDRAGNLVQNPLFSDPNPLDDRPASREPSDVVLMTIVGVPWQDIARRDAEGDPSLLAGLDGQGRPRGGFQSADELVSSGTWELILGDPTAYHAEPNAWPSDPLMRESVEPREGTHPITGDQLAPPDAAVGTNDINGHEYDIPARDDLQLACIFDLPEPRECDGVPVCACHDNDTTNPLCQDGSNAYGTTQYRAGAYPGIRHLQIVQALGPRGALGSICAPQTATPDAADYGYNASMRTLLEALTPSLAKSSE